MIYRTLIISTLIILSASNSSFSELKNDFMISIDNSDFKYIQINGGILLINNCDYEINEIEIQTYPSSSNGITRILGIGSYYLKIESLKQGESVKVDWNKFSNTRGQRLKLEEYSFNRIRISGKKNSGNKESINEHFPCNPNFTVENRGFKIKVKNICHHQIRVAVHYKNTQGSWVTDSWWTFAPNQSGNLVSGDQPLLTGDSRIYYYAETTDRSNIAWSGDKISTYIGFKKYGMREYLDYDGDTYLELNCNNLQ